MKKKLLFILMPVFMVACLLMLASCDAYGGNYTEATGEELTKVETKLNNCAVESETKKTTNYELNISAKVKMSISGGTTEATVTSKQIYDRSNENSATPANYIKYDMNITAKDENMKISSEAWNLTDGTVYYKASVNGNAQGQTFNSNIAKKGTVDKILKDNELSSIQAMMSGVQSALNQTNGKISISAVVKSLNETGVKVYVSGDNKVKIEYAEKDFKATVYIIINNDNTFQMKFEMPESTIGGILGGMTIQETAEIKPTSAKVTAPSGNFEEV